MNVAVQYPKFFKQGLVQAIYRQKTVNLTLIAKEGFLRVFDLGTCPL